MSYRSKKIEKKKKEEKVEEKVEKVEEKVENTNSNEESSTNIDSINIDSIKIDSIKIDSNINNNINNINNNNMSIDLFELNEICLIYYDVPKLNSKVLYECKIVSIKYPDDRNREILYFIHYQGWNKNNDKYVSTESLLKDNTKNRNLQKQLDEKCKISKLKYDEEMKRIKKENDKLKPKIKKIIPIIDQVTESESEEIVEEVKIESLKHKKPAKNNIIDPLDLEFHLNENCLSYYGRVIYPCKILKLQPAKNGEKMFFVHYPGFAKKFDEWVENDRLLKDTVENRILQAKLFKQVNNNEVEDVVTEVYSKVSEDDELAAIISLIPPNYQKELVLEFEECCSLKKLSVIPAPKPISTILDTWAEVKKLKPIGAAMAKGLQVFFDRCLFRNLLYEPEIEQYNTIKKQYTDLKPSELYGLNHLLRLFVNLPNILLNMKDITEDEKSQVIKYSTDFLKYCASLEKPEKLKAEPSKSSRVDTDKLEVKPKRAYNKKDKTEKPEKPAKGSKRKISSEAVEKSN